MKIKKKKLKLDFYASIPDSAQKFLQCPVLHSDQSADCFFSGLNPRRIKIRPLHSSRNCLHIDGAGSNETRQGCRLEKYHVRSEQLEY